MMSDTSPQIGFDRYIQLDWARSALRMRAGFETLEELSDLIDASHRGTAAKKKTRTVLNRLWLDPRSELEELSERAVAIYKSDPGASVAALTWGMAIATYPFFGAVAEIVGRLLRLQGECTSAEVHRRMAEVYGEREGTRRMTNMVLQSQASWGVIERQRQGRDIRRAAGIPVGAELGAWLAEATLRYVGRAIPISSFASHPVLYPFGFDDHLGYNIAQNENLIIKTDGGGDRLVSFS